ncbi:MAG: D-alanine--D-alanine ligase [Lysobacterales bacterium]|jgi:D-alanine-D-alanine ligase|nr:MAG: D-alanine--D-alanine ligase [Xanthomonadales bacterium]
MKKLRVLVLVHETLVPPDSSDGYSMQEIDEWRTEYDVTTSLRAMGHEVRVLGMGDNLAELRSAITDWRPDVAFNLLEEFQGIVTYDQYVVAYLELMKLPYTGCNPRGMMISRDKALSKQVLSYHRIPTPRFVLLPRNRRYREPRRLAYPLFVKSATEDASLGISQASIVHDPQRLRERVEFIHDQTSSDALVEEYIEGREIYIGVVGNERLTTFPLWELDFGTLPEVMAGIATRKVKWDRKYQRKHGIGTGPARELPEGLAPRVAQIARRIYRALCLSGYARIDLRLRPDGSVFVLEANANPNLAQIEDLATSALSSGVGYDALLEQILRYGLSYQAAWRQA